MDTFETPQSTTGSESAPKQNGSYLAVIIVILIIILGGAYFWYARTVVAPTVDQAGPDASDEILRNDLQASGALDIEEDLKGLDEEYGN